MRSSCALLTTAGCVLVLPAFASAEPWGGAFTFYTATTLMTIAGALGVGLSAVLGASALIIAVRANLDSSAKVFARGFLGVSAVAVFFVSVFLLVVGLGLATMLFDLMAVLFGVISLALVFLAVEFAIAAKLYLQVRQRTGGAVAAVLGWSCVGLSAAIGLLAFGSFLITIDVAWNGPPHATPAPSGEP